MREGSRRGRASLVGLALLLALGISPSPSSADSAFDDPIGPLPWRVPGPLGFTVDAAAFPDSVGLWLEIYVRLTPATIESLEPDETSGRNARISARLKNAFGARQHSASQEFRIAADDTSSSYGKVVFLRLPTVPGVQELQVKLEDQNSRKRGLLYIGRRVTNSREVTGEFEIPEPSHEIMLSDPEFALTEQRALGASPFTRFGRIVVPNPERLYGLLVEELRVFFIGRGRPEDSREWRWQARVLDSSGEVVATQMGQALPGQFLNGYFSTEIKDLPAGGYDLELQAWHEGDAMPEPRRTRFSLAWKADTWIRNRRDLEDNVHFLLMPEAEEEFRRLQPGEQERYIDDFWLVRDPTPDTPLNEARRDFLRRIEIANERFTRRGIGRGMFSDMGRVFIRYGEPSETLNQVIPTGDNTLLQVLQELSVTEDRVVGDVRQSGPGGDMRPFEVWIYEGNIPVPPDADPRVDRRFRGRRLVFLFVDEQGLGDFRLRYSTE